MNRGMIEHYKKAYPAGARIKLLSMEGESQMPAGLEGEVMMVDDAGQVHVNWNNGSTLAVIPGVDSFQKIESVLDELAFEQTM